MLRGTEISGGARGEGASHAKLSDYVVDWIRNAVHRRVESDKAEYYCLLCLLFLICCVVKGRILCAASRPTARCTTGLSWTALCSQAGLINHRVFAGALPASSTAESCGAFLARDRCSQSEDLGT